VPPRITPEEHSHRLGRLRKSSVPGRCAKKGSIMLIRKIPVDFFFKTCGIVSPYLAVFLGVFYFKNAFFALLLYHLTLSICIIEINGVTALKLIKSDPIWHISRLICLSGLLSGVVIYFLWPIAKLESINLVQLMESVNLKNTSFIFFALYVCIVNPFLEESLRLHCQSFFGGILLARMF
jgi:membrane protease YdiL (CAAX protease family)